MLPVQQGRNEDRWHPVQEATLAPPCSNLRSLYCIEECTCGNVGIFGAPIVIRRPSNCAPLPLSLRPCSAVRDSGVDLHDTRGVTRLNGARGKTPPCLNLRSYESKFTVLKKVIVTLLGIFGTPRSHSPPP